MKAPLVNGGLVRVEQATPDELAALAPIVAAGRRFAGEKLVGLYFVVARDLAESAGAAPKHLFCLVGNQWKVIFDGREPFYLEDTLGAWYLDYLLHHPNEPISAFDLEVAVQPEKGEARVKESIQPESDPRAKRAYREALRLLQAETRGAKKAGDQARVCALGFDIKKINAALNKRGVMADTGERARSNVRHAVRYTVKLLRKGGPQERAFADHLQACLSTGHECLYSQSEGRIWA